MKVALQPFRRNFLCDVLQIGAGAGRTQRQIANVGAEDLQGEMQPLPPTEFVQTDGQRINFFPRGASWYPNPEETRRARLFDNLTQTFRKRAKSIRIAEKLGHRNEQILKEILNLFRMCLQILQVFAGVQRSSHRHPPPDAPQGGRFFVVAKIHIRGAVNQFEDLIQIVVLVRWNLWRFVFLQMQNVGMPAHARQLLRDLCGGEYKVRRSTGDGALWHSLKLGGAFCLDKGDAASSFDGLQSFCAVIPSAG